MFRSSVLFSMQYSARPLIQTFFEGRYHCFSASLLRGSLGYAKAKTHTYKILIRFLFVFLGLIMCYHEKAQTRGMIKKMKNENSRSLFVVLYLFLFYCFAWTTTLPRFCFNSVFLQRKTIFLAISCY